MRRNNELARVFHDLKLMEREGSGYDLLYEVLLSQGRPLPRIIEETDRVTVVVARRIIKPEVIDFLEKAERTLNLRQREKTVLGLLSQNEAMTARELARALDLPEASAVSLWVGRLREWRVVMHAGKTKGTRYYIDPAILRRLEFPSQTSLARIPPHRLMALIEEDLHRNPWSSFGEIHQRIGMEIPAHQIRKQLRRLVDGGSIVHRGQNRWRRYAVK